MNSLPLHLHLTLANHHPRRSLERDPQLLLLNAYHHLLVLAGPRLSDQGVHIHLHPTRTLSPSFNQSRVHSAPQPPPSRSRQPFTTPIRISPDHLVPLQFSHLHPRSSSAISSFPRWRPSHSTQILSKPIRSTIRHHASPTSLMVVRSTRPSPLFSMTLWKLLLDQVQFMAWKALRSSLQRRPCRSWISAGNPR